MTTSCTWSPACNTDLDPSDCCVSTADPSVTQTIGAMHNKWHQCLGNIGTSFSPPPPGRGQRWAAFHRQLERDFNEYREPTWPKIDSLEWCPGMNMPYGHFGGGLSFGDHPYDCGIGLNRPNDVSCVNCTAFSQCLFLTVGGVPGGPVNCSATAGCSAGGVSFPYTSLDQFTSIDEISTLLDAYFHSDMHIAVAFADGSGYVADASDPRCSTRDAMFWRLHKALDDVVRAWQDDKAVDVTLVIDRSGSMGAASGTGVGTRLDNAKEAVDMFADLLEDGRSDGGTNRLGIISYSSTASNAAMNMALTDVDATLRDLGGPFDTTLTAISSGGSTSIGSGIEGAVAQLCPGADCQGFIAGPGENQRKAMLLLTDGRENTSPCLEPGCAGGGGTVIDYSKLDTAQLCAVGLGNAASINGDLLTILAERQGGIYMNDTDSTGTDLKDFFVKCYAQLTDEFVGLDPNGLLGASEAATPIIPYDSCDESRLIFTGGWTVRPPFASPLVEANRLNLLVNAPDGTPWVPTAGSGEASSEELWAFKRVPLPYQGESQGTWTMQLVRPQRAFVNGFTSDSFVDSAQGVEIIRRQIQRMCPVGDVGERTCERVLYYEDLTLGTSVYQEALSKELAFTVGAVTSVNQPADLLSQLQSGPWDLVIYASQPLGDAAQSYDSLLAANLCQGQRAIVTETRRISSASDILACAGAFVDPSTVNMTGITGDADFLDIQASLGNSSRPIFSYALIGSGDNNTTADAHFDPQTAAIVGTVVEGGDAINWHANVLVKGLTKLTPFVPKSKLKTGDALQAGVRILPSYQRAGGYPDGIMSVEVERPVQGFGSLVSHTTSNSTGVRDDPIGSLEEQIGVTTIPTTKAVYGLNDRGENGDLHAQNGTFMANLPISAAVDGMYTLHYVFEYPVGTCTARRELKQSLFIDVKISPNDSNIVIHQPTPGQTQMVYQVDLSPSDALGNSIGPGRQINQSCTGECSCDSFTDNNDGSYSISVEVPFDADITQCQMQLMGTSIPLLGGPVVGVPMLSTGGLLILLLLLWAIAWRIFSRNRLRSV